MGNNLARRLQDGFKGLVNDERGAESSEVILVLVLLVVGLMGVWFALRNKLKEKVTETTTCIDGAATAASCSGQGN